MSRSCIPGADRGWSCIHIPAFRLQDLRGLHMKTLPKVAIAITLVALLGVPKAVAGPIPALGILVSSPYELVKERKARPQKTSTKSWFKRKANRTSAWVKRQTRKVKSAFK